MLHDFLDRRAAIRRCKNIWTDIALVAVPTSTIAILTVSDLLTKWLAQFRAASPLVHAVLPVAAVALSLFVINARGRDDDQPAGFQANGPISTHWVYRFCNSSRQTAKATVLPMIGIALASVWTITPNAVRRIRGASGYVCSADGLAIRRGFVQLRDRYGSPVSVQVEIDDRGFFFTRPERWRMAPASVQLVATGCEPSELPYDTGLIGRSCPSEPIDNPQTGDAHVWVFRCR